MARVEPGHPISHQMIGLDLMRGLAAMLVFVGHVRKEAFVEYGALANGHGLHTAIGWALTRIGHESVLIFFVLSGFLVGGQIIRRTEAERFSIAAYAVDRSTRILLPLVPACLLTAAITAFIIHEPVSAREVLLNMVGLNEIVTTTLKYNAPLWTLSYEIWFYILAGAIGFLLSTRRPSITALIVLMIGLAVFSVIEARFFLYWMLGALAVFFLNVPHRWWYGAAGLVITCVGILGYQLALASNAIKGGGFLTPALSEFTICAGVALLIPLMASPAMNAILAPLRAPIQHLSAISYSLYLFHYPINAAFGPYFPRASNLNWDSIGVFWMKIVVILVAVHILYFLFERNTVPLRAVLSRSLLVRPVEKLAGE